MRAQGFGYGIGSDSDVVGYGDGSRFTARSIPLLSTIDRFQAAFSSTPRPVVTTAEFKALMAAEKEDAGGIEVKEIAMIIFCTGIIPEELANVLWEDVDLDNHEIWVRGNRHRDGRRVPFGNQIAGIFQARRTRQRGAASGSYVFLERVLIEVSQRLKLLSMQVLRRPVTLATLRLAFLMRWREVGENPGALALITGIAPIRLRRPDQTTEPLFRTAAKIQNWLESLV